MTVGQDVIASLREAVEIEQARHALKEGQEQGFEDWGDLKSSLGFETKIPRCYYSNRTDKALIVRGGDSIPPAPIEPE